MQNILPTLILFMVRINQTKWYLRAVQGCHLILPVTLSGPLCCSHWPHFQHLKLVIDNNLCDATIKVLTFSMTLIPFLSYMLQLLWYHMYSKMQKKPFSFFVNSKIYVCHPDLFHLITYWALKLQLGSWIRTSSVRCFLNGSMINNKCNPNFYQLVTQYL